MIRQRKRPLADYARVVGNSEVIQFDGLSAFRPCGRDLAELFKSTRRALFVTRQLDFEQLKFRLARNLGLIPDLIGYT